jgi:hypothetical protein
MQSIPVVGGRPVKLCEVAAETIYARFNKDEVGHGTFPLDQRNHQ